MEIRMVSSGNGQFHNDMLYLIHREGYIEECYFSFTLSPIFKEDGTVGGVFNAVQETTQRVLAARRLKTLSELGNRTPGAKTMESACHLVSSTLRDCNKDITFSLIYAIKNYEKEPKINGKKAYLVATTFDTDLEVVKSEDEIEELVFVKGKSTRELPDFLLDTFETVDLQCDKDNSFNKVFNNQDASLKSILDLTAAKPSAWPIEQVVSSNSQLIVTLEDNSRAILLPVHTSFAGKTLLTAIVICGLNQNRALDREYLDFLHVCIKLDAVLLAFR
ncbi:3016_t:CDS:2 [Acaulospora colombiana]|uniref:3016_t:CDS:1 n=1 Tax=Acaulospora colombiana TaxID=27376 RepID=A0ACA9LDM0_9GLOM|nr:3016_t:CDS:2 [Acaulospora colombiana]